MFDFISNLTSLDQYLASAIIMLLLVYLVAYYCFTCPADKRLFYKNSQADRYALESVMGLMHNFVGGDFTMLPNISYMLKLASNADINSARVSKNKKDRLKNLWIIYSSLNFFDTDGRIKNKELVNILGLGVRFGLIEIQRNPHHELSRYKLTINGILSLK